MAVLSNLLNIGGAFFLVHAVYSSYEHSLLDELVHTATPSPQTVSTRTLPIDIVVELLLAVLLLCIGIVTASADFKPIKWSIWAGQLERSKDARKITAFGEGGGNPYARLEDRAGFLDVRSGKDIKR
ncbi:hypothetical protein AMS68_006921 [Peltaster fructicola]|uniref:Membrane magnesium transporter n=1 Tax=Peltaster fructicola TaxID=286661 RepID=A0A6H0Y322_9PEZI|nr:hypothetical protein AMS68_006921 [Peltaster fructicola]